MVQYCLLWIKGYTFWRNNRRPCGSIHALWIVIPELVWDTAIWFIWRYPSYDMDTKEENPLFPISKVVILVIFPFYVSVIFPELPVDDCGPYMLRKLVEGTVPPFWIWLDISWPIHWSHSSCVHIRSPHMRMVLKVWYVKWLSLKSVRGVSALASGKSTIVDDIIVSIIATNVTFIWLRVRDVN